MSRAISSVASILKRLEGKVAVITGGASGIGECTARLFVNHGANVIIADVQDEPGLSVCEEIGSPGTVSYVHCDVTKEIDVQKAVETAICKHGKLDIMLSNAGINGSSVSTIEGGADYENFQRVTDVNVFGAFLCAKHAARVMVPNKRGSIIFTASGCTVNAGDVSHAYMASKHAVVGLTNNLCVELGSYGVRVNCISPFGVATPMLLSEMGLLPEQKGVVEGFVREIANLKEVTLEAIDVAEAALYLASDESRYVSGLNLVVDGGYSTTNVALTKGLKKSPIH